MIIQKILKLNLLYYANTRAISLIPINVLY